MNWILENVTEEEKNKIFVFGHSLGGAVAIDLVSKNNEHVKGLIVENSFLSIPQVVSDNIPLLHPVASFIHQKLDSATAIEKVTVPILFLSGLDDRIVPPAHMKKLEYFAKLSNYIEFKGYPDRNHNDTLLSNQCQIDVANFLLKDIPNLEDVSQKQKFKKFQ